MRPRSPPRRRSSERRGPKWSSLRRMRAGAAIDSKRRRIFRRATPSRRSFRSREACPRTWWTSSPQGTRTARSPIRSNGIAIVQPLSRGQALGRVDLVFDRRTRRDRARPALRAARHLRAADSSNRTLHRRDRTGCAGDVRRKNRHAGPAIDPSDGGSTATCSHAAGDGARRVARSPRSVASAISDRRSETSSPMRCATRCRAPTLRSSTTPRAGLWADLPDGPLTFGRLYDVFPFDNRVVRIELSGADLGRWLTGEIQEGRRGWLGISGIELRPSCVADRLHVDLVRAAGPIRDDDRLVAVTIAGPTLSGSLASAVLSRSLGPANSLGAGPSTSLGAGATRNAPVVREVVEDWFRRMGRRAHGQLGEAALRHPDDAGARIDCVSPAASLQRD